MPFYNGIFKICMKTQKFSNRWASVLTFDDIASVKTELMLHYST